MEYGAIVALLVGACFGVFLAARHFLRLRMPPWVAVAHGVAGATGFGLLVVAVLGRPTFSLGRVALAILVFAVVMGCVNVVFHIRGIRHKSALIVGHALLAVSGVTTLATSLVLGPSEIIPMGAPSIARASAGDFVATGRARAVIDAPADAPRQVEQGVVPTPAASERDVVAFDRGSASLDAASLAVLDRIAERLRSEASSDRYVIRGHSDSQGPRFVNARFARARAWSVFLALIARGIDPSRLRVVGVGASCPSDAGCRDVGDTARCSSDEARQRDRRASLARIPDGASRRWLSTCAER